MSQTVTLQLSDEALNCYQRGALAARKPLAEFLVERLVEAVSPLTDDLPSPLHQELEELEHLDDETLRRIARCQLSPVDQRRYQRLLLKNSHGTLTEQEKEDLHKIGEQARILSLKAAHASMILKWRGQRVPFPTELRQPE